MIISSLGFLSSLLFGLAAAQSKFIPARPPAIPLAVKSPYLSTWLNAGSDGGNGGYLPGAWPTFWAGQITGWAGLIRVDGSAFTWMGSPQGIPLANQTALEYTSTRSIFTLEVGGKVGMNVTFLSPLTPHDLKRQSLLFSYLDVEVWSLDGAEHDVQVYTDISAEWVSGDHNDVAQWKAGATSDALPIAYHQVWKQIPMLFSEKSDQAEWGNIYYATNAVDGLTSQSGADTDVRGGFVQNGVVAGSEDANYRAINSRWPVFAFSRNLGRVGSQSQSTLFSIGLCQNEAIQFLGNGGVTTLNSLWKSYFSDDLAALSFFHTDYSVSSRLSTDLDNQIAGDSLKAAGSNYHVLTTLAARQAFGALQLVGTSDKQYLFLKEISSDGNIQTVDVIFPFMPILLYTNPELMRLLLDALLENQESGHYPNAWSMHDLGSSYPNATGHPEGNDEAMPLEECGNMLIMMLGYVQRSKNTKYVQDHYKLLKQWTEYLVQYSLYPANQLSTDDFAGPLHNQTNLALKGMVGLEAMAQLASLIGNDADAKNYSSIAHSYIDQWVNLGNNHDANPPHSILNYGNPDSHGLLYNLYADALLSLSLVPQSIYAQQSAFYPSVALDYGVPLDTRHTWTKSDWEVWVAAVAEKDTRDLILGKVAGWVGKTGTSRPMTDLYDAKTGGYPDGIVFTARPVVGGYFALLALP